uniref:Uncharacterized protein n=1 Tax=Branchiostoma floridae TaxID=7739 RepID=C3YIA5_BRAFL|eukprot:XP_002604231.1 hypothetical protein BRAFLDRAFT_73430 [Branchiostoma floridae]
MAEIVEKLLADVSEEGSHDHITLNTWFDKVMKALTVWLPLLVSGTLFLGEITEKPNRDTDENDDQSVGGQQPASIVDIEEVLMHAQHSSGGPSWGCRSSLQKTRSRKTVRQVMTKDWLKAMLALTIECPFCCSKIESVW